MDTSALVKLYVEEEGASAVRRAVEEAEAVSTCVIAYAEARAALARRYREGALDEGAHRTAVTALDDDWHSLVRLEVNDALARLAGVLAEQRRLRGFAAVHLAAALTLQQLGEVTVMAYDQRLLEAASDLLTVWGRT